MKKVFVSHSEVETAEFAKEFVKTLRGGEVVALIGELGSGKTTFVRGLARAFGIREPVRSPTFTLMHVHRVKKELGTRDSALGIRNLVHVDAYRLKNARELEEIGIGEYFGRPDTVVLIEWADRVRPILRRVRKVVRMYCAHGTSPEERRFRIDVSCPT